MRSRTPPFFLPAAAGEFPAVTLDAAFPAFAAPAGKDAAVDAAADDDDVADIADVADVADVADDTALAGDRAADDVPVGMDVAVAGSTLWSLPGSADRQPNQRQPRPCLGIRSSCSFSVMCGEVGVGVCE